MPVYTFIEKHSWKGNTVIPFCTHEGSGLGNTPTYLKNACKGATVGEGLAIQGSTAQKQQETARASQKKWLKDLWKK